MKKRLLAVLLAVCLFASLMPVTALAADTAAAGDTTIVLPDGCGSLTLSNSIVRVDTETVLTVIGKSTTDDSSDSSPIYELRDQPVYVIPFGTTITFPDDYYWSVGVYSSEGIVVPEFGQVDDYVSAYGSIGTDPTYTETSKESLQTTYIYCISNCEYNPDLADETIELTVDKTEETTTEDGSTTVYEYYSEDSIAALTGIFVRYELSENPFTDVTLTDNTSWYYNPVLWAAACGITTGITETTFAPDMICNRAQIVTFLWRAAGCPEPTSDENPFEDVVKTDDTAWYYDAVLWAVENGITKGIDEEHFDPYGYCTRAQVATFIWRYDGEGEPFGENIFTDVTLTDNTSWYYDAVLWCADMGIVEGRGNGIFDPDTTCTRAEVVTMLYRN